MLRTTLTTLWSRKRRLAATSIAVVLGVAFLAATMILGSTTKAGFRDTFTTANDGTDVVVRHATRIGSEESRMRGLIDESTVADVAAVDGVATAVAEVRGTAQLIGADGQPIGGDGPPTIAANWIADTELSWLTLSDGRPPQASGEVVVDQGTAERANLSVGDRDHRAHAGAGVRHRRRSGDLRRDRTGGRRHLRRLRHRHRPAAPRRQRRLDHRGARSGRRRHQRRGARRRGSRPPCPTGSRRSPAPS